MAEFGGFGYRTPQQNPPRNTSNNAYGQFNHSGDFQRSYLPRMPNSIKNRGMDRYRQHLNTSNEEYGHFWVHMGDPKGGPMPAQFGRVQPFRPKPREHNILKMELDPQYSSESQGPGPSPDPRVPNYVRDYLNCNENGRSPSPDQQAAMPRLPDPNESPRGQHPSTLRKKWDDPLPPIAPDKTQGNNPYPTFPDKGGYGLDAILRIPDIKTIELLLHMEDSSVLKLKALPYGDFHFEM